MEPFTRHTGLVAALDRSNVDTDQIMPKQFLKRIERTGYGQFLFYDWRYLEDGQTPNEAFELNHPRFQGATILLTRHNFGCGSSREHAPWGLQQYGFRAIIAPSFADIFYNNCFQNGLLPVVLPEGQVDELFRKVAAHSDFQLTVDLEALTVTDAFGYCARFAVDATRRNNLLNGLDDTGLTLQRADAITVYESRMPAWRSQGIRS